MQTVKARLHPNRWGVILSSTKNIFANAAVVSLDISFVFQGVKLLSLPPILCIHLKRYRNFRGSTMKLDCKVTFPETFKFSEMVQEAFCTGFSQVLLFLLHNLDVRSFVIYNLVCSYRTTASTLCMQWWSTLDLQHLGTIRRTFATRWTTAGTTLMTAMCDRYVQ